MPTRALMLLLLTVAGAGSVRAQDAAEYPRRAQFGMNLSRVTDWSREWAFVDVFKSSRPWMQTGPGIRFDPRGNPLLDEGKSVETLMLRELEGRYPGGVYVVAYEGLGRVEMRRWDVSRMRREA